MYPSFSFWCICLWLIDSSHSKIVRLKGMWCGALAELSAETVCSSAAEDDPFRRYLHRIDVGCCSNLIQIRSLRHVAIHSKSPNVFLWEKSAHWHSGLLACTVYDHVISSASPSGGGFLKTCGCDNPPDNFILYYTHSWCVQVHLKRFFSMCSFRMVLPIAKGQYAFDTMLASMLVTPRLQGSSKYIQQPTLPT